jgi:hypothetical protein
MNRRVQRRYAMMVQQHMKSSNRNAAGPLFLAGESLAASATQAAWRFLNNPNVSLTDLVEPLRQAGRDACRQSESEYVLLAHDWCKIDYKNHSSKPDLRQITHETDVGYDMTSALLVDAGNGHPLAPMQMHLKTADTLYSTATQPPDVDAHHRDQVAPTMEEAGQWGLERKVVHVIDREADSLGRLRTWVAAGHLFLVRSDDRRVLWNGESRLISDIQEHFNSQRLFEPVGEAKHHGHVVSQEVAETEIVLHRPHSAVIDGRKRQVQGEPLRVRLVVTRLLDDDDFIVAQRTLLTNVFDDGISAVQIARWYYWRWLIETFSKLLKSHGQELEQWQQHSLEPWQQHSGEAIARRILVASMACVIVWSLQHDDSAEAAATRKILVRLSGRQMKHGCLSTAPALLAGYMALLSLNDLLTETDIDIGQLKRIAKTAMPVGAHSSLASAQREASD